MKGLTKSQLLEYVITKRDFYRNDWKEYRNKGNIIEANNMWYAYNALDTVYRCMTDNDFARRSYKDWTGKEL